MKNSTTLQAGPAIKAELKSAFPGFKFSVTSQSFSMGSSVTVTWTDGPTVEEVEAIVNKYQYANYDGMSDIWEYSNRRNDIPQTKYVCTSRTVSPENKALIAAEFKFDSSFSENEKGRMIHEAVYKRSFYAKPAKAERKAVVKSPIVAASDIQSIKLYVNTSFIQN